MVSVAVMFGSNDIEKAKTFYDALMPTIGLKGLYEHGSGGRIYGTPAGVPILSIVRPFNGNAATAGNGTIGSLMCDSQEQVKAIHAKALELGGADEGAPGPRGPEGTGAFAAYFRDLDGNKICAIHISLG
jgi:catechol 2,3-dioxygenase-like lactoylglutathione lyase family enzyme